MKGTFSILAYNQNAKLLGVAVASGSLFVGDRVPHAKPGVGVIATQAYTNISYGVKGLQLLSSGLPPDEVLNKLLGEDDQKEKRQVAIMDFHGRKAVFTGSQTPEFRGEILGRNYVVVGNFLANNNVVGKIAETLEKVDGALAYKMVEALKAGTQIGGDKRGERSAALIVVSEEKVEVEIKINAHEKPIEELRKFLHSFRRNYTHYV